jgi:DNA-binding beta-propeller fold protein YncE
MAFQREAKLLVIAAFLAAPTALGWFGDSEEGLAKTRVIGSDRIVSWTSLAEPSGEMCEYPAPGMSSTAGVLQQTASGAAAASQAGAAPSAAARAAVASRKPASIITDPQFSFAGIAVDPVRNEVIMADENRSNLVVYDRRTNTPPTARMSEPKRIVGGTRAFLEYVCSVYVDPVTGDIYGVNNDTMNWLPVFGRDQQGNIAPKRKLRPPHTTFGIAVDEVAQEMFLTIQDDHAVVVFRKDAKDEDKALRVLQGSRTKMADPHGMALDPKRGEIFITNWGTSNERPPLTEGGGGGNVDRTDFPVGRRRAFPGSGKIEAPSITIYPKNAQGDTPPTRIIQGPRTQLNWPTAVAVHPERGELFVANDTGHAVLVFPVDANGDVAPIRVLKGPRSLIKNPTGVAIDLMNNELWVANFGNHTATVFRIDANGDVPPLRVIRSAPPNAPSPMLSNAHTVAFDTKREELLVAN